MEQKYLIDTNAAIDYLDNKLPQVANNLIDSIESLISVITRMELLAWSGATRQQTTVLEEFINYSMVYPLDEAVILKAIEIRKTYKTKLPDAIIAATALVYSLALVTRNTTDFKNIYTLQVLDPFDLTTTS